MIILEYKIDQSSIFLEFIIISSKINFTKLNLWTMEFWDKNPLADTPLSLYIYIYIYIVSEWLLFNTNSTIFQLYHGENKLIFNEMMMRSTLYKTNTLSWIFSVSSLKQQSAYRHVTPLGHFILIPKKPGFALSP